MEMVVLGINSVAIKMAKSLEILGWGQLKGILHCFFFHCSIDVRQYFGAPEVWVFLSQCQIL